MFQHPIEIPAKNRVRHWNRRRNWCHEGSPSAPIGTPPLVRFPWQCQSPTANLAGVLVGRQATAWPTHSSPAGASGTGSRRMKAASVCARTSRGRGCPLPTIGRHKFRDIGNTWCLIRAVTRCAARRRAISRCGSNRKTETRLAQVHERQRAHRWRTTYHLPNRCPSPDTTTISSMIRTDR